MALKIRLATGEIKTYSTNYSSLGVNPSHHTKCGMFWPNNPAQDEECDHLDCAIVAAEHNFRACILFLAFCFFFIVFTRENIVTLEGIIDLAMIVFGALIITFMVYALYHSIQSKNELTEFRDKGTIDGIKAKIHGH